MLIFNYFSTTTSLMKTATGKVIKTFRNHFGYTQQFVADKLNITTATLANLENGRVSLDIEKLYNLAKVFEVPIKDYLRSND